MSHDDLMRVRPWRMIGRRKSRQIHVGRVAVGGDAPISVQTMTNTLTTDAQATIRQIMGIEEAGCDIVRVSCPDAESTAALGEIVRNVNIPIVADIHFHYRRAIEAAQAGAACLRINPGNIGGKDRVREVVQAAKDHGCSIRIGVNGGSLERHLLEQYGEPCPEAMVASALFHAEMLEEHDFRDYKISVKASDVFLTVAAYQALAEATDAPLHLGVTEAGGRRIGTVKSSIGMGNLLWAGIGDTIRVSLSDDPAEEVRVGFDMLKSLNLRVRGVNIISCPSCARQGFEVIDTVRALEDRLAHIAQPITLSIIGCVVNGPGEAAYTDLGFTGGGKDAGMLYVSGKPSAKVSNADMIDRIVDMVERKAEAMAAEAASAGPEAAKTAAE
jgi:(E)-4-hydroxy-3-methylbut-2-enyl-diphosphate synthase